MTTPSPDIPASKVNAESTAPVMAGLTVGFATSGVMWTLGYLLRLPGIEASTALVGILLLLTQAGGAVSAGIVGPARRAGLTGLTAGLTTGLINLLILGSLLFEGGEEASRPSPALVTAGWILYSGVLGMVGAWLGASVWRGEYDAAQDRRDWLARFGVVGALTVIPLLLIGSVVTTSDTGMAVPDWPNTFGTNMFLFPLSRMTGGVYYEHTHRLFGALVGLTALTLMVLTIRSDHRAPIKRLAIAVFALVVVQGVLGGLRVTESSRALALVHGVLAHVVFALFVALAAMLSRRWNDGHAPAAHERAQSLVRMAWAGIALVVVQIALGGVIRHFSGAELSVHAVLTHAGFAVVVFGHLAAFGGRLAAAQDAPPPLRRIGLALLSVLSLQMLLGIIALGVALIHQDRAEAPPLRLVVASMHQTIGALLLASTALGLIWVKRTLTQASGAGEPNTD